MFSWANASRRVEFNVMTFKQGASQAGKVLSLLILILLTACQAGRADAILEERGSIIEEQAAAASDALLGETGEAAEATPTQASFEVETIAKEINPLTGLPQSEISLLERWPVAVKITSYPSSNRPQWGLSFADIVYEYYHNNELTRFHAIFYGRNAEFAGPIRSGRLFDDYLMKTYGSVMAFASADYRILDRLRSEYPAWRTIYLLEGRCPPRPVCRYEPATYNYLLADTAEVSDYVESIGRDNQRQALDSMRFASLPSPDGDAVERIYLRYSYSAYAYWDYDAETGNYLRYQDALEDLGGRGEKYSLLTDRINNQAIRAENVVVLYVPHFHFFYRSAEGGIPAIEVVDMDFVGRGQAFAFRDGRAFELEWQREKGEQLYLVDANGKAYPFKPGTTWFQVMTDESVLEQSEGSWRFNFVFYRP